MIRGRRILIACGILTSLLYAAMLIFIPLEWKSYSSFSQTVSELSAVDAPTRSLWVPLGVLYTLLFTGFGWGVRTSAVQNRPLRIAGSLLMTYGILGLAWPPMHQREILAAGGATLTDTMHIVFTIATVLLMVLAMGFGAAAFGKGFRLYSIVTIIVLFIFGILTSIGAPRVQANLPTPWIGVWERINIGVFLLWVVVLALVLLRPEKTPYQ